MAFVRLAFFPGATRAHYEALAAEMRGAAAPPGRFVFAAGPCTGGWQVVQVWTSRAELDAFNREHFSPALAALGPAAFPAPPVVTDVVTVDLAVRAPH